MKVKRPERYQVEWCSVMPVTEEGDADVDRATYEHREFKTAQQAWLFTRELFDDFDGTCYPRLAMGCMVVRHQFGEIDADTLEVEGLERMRWDDTAVCELSSPSDSFVFDPVYNTYG